MKNNANVFLAIDDKIENLISIKALIKESFSDAVVLIAQSGKEGLLLAREHNPDIILLDVMMPDMNGYDVCQILKADPVLQDIPVVFVTALSGDRETRLKAFEIGAEAFIHKPIDELELQIQLRTLLRLRHLNILKKERMNSLEEGLTNKTEALDASEQRFKIMINSISDTIGITDVNGIIKYRSPNNIPLFGIDPSETIGKQSFDFVHPDDREQIRQKLVNLVNEGPGAKQTGEFKYLRSDGSLVYVQLEGRNMIDDPIINGLLLTYRDITDKKVATRKLEEESEKLRALIESTEDLVWLVDPEDFGLITYNSALYHYFELGRGLHITPGMKPEDLLPENFASQWKSMYHSVLEKGAYKTEYTASALSRTLLLSFYPVKVENVTIGISVLGQDITDKKKSKSLCAKVKNASEASSTRWMMWFIPWMSIIVIPAYLEAGSRKTTLPMTFSLEKHPLKYLEPKLGKSMKKRFRKRWREITWCMNGPLIPVLKKYTTKPPCHQCIVRMGRFMG